MHVAIDLGAGSGCAFPAVSTSRPRARGCTFTYGRPSAGHLRWDMTALHAARSRPGGGAERAAASDAVAASASTRGASTTGDRCGGRSSRAIPTAIRAAGVMDAVLAACPGRDFPQAPSHAHQHDLPAGGARPRRPCGRRCRRPADADLCSPVPERLAAGSTDASTTQLLNATTRQWDDAPFATGLAGLMPALVDPPICRSRARLRSADQGAGPIRGSRRRRTTPPAPSSARRSRRAGRSSRRARGRWSASSAARRC